MAPTPAQSRPHLRPFLAWVWAGLLVVGGLAYLLFSTGIIAYHGPLILLLAGGTALLAIPFFARWLSNRAEWWALIVSWVFLAIAILLLVILLDLPTSQIVLIVILAEVAAPFWVVYLVNRQSWWALIPAYGLVMLAGLTALTIFAVTPTTIGAFALLALALPFWLIYMLDRLRWWAIIPAGALSVIAVILLVSASFVQLGNVGLTIVFNAALAGVSLAIWLTVRRFDWALWLAIGFAVAAVASIWFPPGAGWAIVALSSGLYIAYRQIDAARKRQAAVPQPPTIQPTQSPAPPSPPSATASSSPPQPSASATPPASAPVPPGLLADREATAGHEARAGQSGGPVVEFRPLDPFKARRDKQEDEE